jgi:hypothetical protein
VLDLVQPQLAGRRLRSIGGKARRNEAHRQGTRTQHASHAITALGTAGHAIMQGDVITPLGILGGAVGNNILARLFSYPATAASTARWARAYNQLVNKPTRPSIATFNSATHRLASTAAPQIGWKGNVDDLSQRIQSATSGQEQQPKPEGQLQ